MERRFLAEHEDAYRRIQAAIAGDGRGLMRLIASRRRPPEAGIPTLAVPPRGPLPLRGGAEAPLDFSED